MPVQHFAYWMLLAQNTVYFSVTMYNSELIVRYTCVLFSWLWKVCMRVHCMVYVVFQWCFSCRTCPQVQRVRWQQSFRKVLSLGNESHDCTDCVKFWRLYTVFQKKVSSDGFFVTTSNFLAKIFVTEGYCLLGGKGSLFQQVVFMTRESSPARTGSLTTMLW